MKTPRWRWSPAGRFACGGDRRRAGLAVCLTATGATSLTAAKLFGGKLLDINLGVTNRAAHDVIALADFFGTLDFSRYARFLLDNGALGGLHHRDVAFLEGAEVGPGKVLQGLVRKIAPEATAASA